MTQKEKIETKQEIIETDDGKLDIPDKYKGEDFVYVAPYVKKVFQGGYIQSYPRGEDDEPYIDEGKCGFKLFGEDEDE